jgi:hypothetical protein
MKRRNVLAVGAFASLSLLISGQPAIAENVIANGANNASETAGGQFYAALRAKTLATVGDIHNATIYPIEPAAQGGFAPNWQNGDNVFNEQTYKYISGRITPGSSPDSVALSGAGSFPDAYRDVIAQLEYRLSNADLERINEANSRGASQASTIVAEFQTLFGVITEADLQEAKKELKGRTKVDKISYVVQYVMAGSWGPDDKRLTLVEMQKARSLKDILPNAPAAAGNIIRLVSAWLNIVQTANVLTDQADFGTQMLNDIKTNLGSKQSGFENGAEKGSMKTFAPNDGTIGRAHRYSIPMSTSDIQNGLDSSRTITVNALTKASSDGQVDVNVEGKYGFKVGSWLSFSTKGSGEYNMSTQAGAGTSTEVQITYPGYTIVPIEAAPWAQATREGWFTTDPIRQAWANWDSAAGKTKDVTGFRFTNQPKYNLAGIGEGGVFGHLTNVVISKAPTIKVIFKDADYATFKETWRQDVSGNLKLFGFINLASFSEGAYRGKLEEGATNSTFSLSFSASPEVLAVPNNMRTAYVIGGTVGNGAGS